MEFTCGHCKAKLNIPDEKIPKDQRVKVRCPKCNKRIILDTREAEAEKPASDNQVDFHETGEFYLKALEKRPASAEEEDSYGYDDYSEDDSLDFFEEETKLALVMESNDEHAEKIRIAVKELGYKCISTPNTRDALGKMRFHHFDLVILSDGFDGQPLEGSPTINFINHFSMLVRRKIFLTLLSDKFKTTDNMMCFAMSANLVANKRDLDRLPVVLKKAISDNEKFYKVLMDTMSEIGKG